MGWKIGGVLTLVLAGVAALVSATTPAEYKTGIEWGIAAIFLVLAVLCFWRGSKASARKKAEQEDRNETYMSDQDLQQIQVGELPVLSSVPVILDDGEQAHFFAPARRYITKKKAVGRTGSGGGASQTVYDDVTDAFAGRVVLTNRRIVFLAEQNGFECKLSAISAIAPEGGRLLIQAGSKSYGLAVAQQGHFAKVLEMVARK